MSDFRYTIVIPTKVKGEDDTYFEVYGAPKIPEIGDKLQLHNQLWKVKEVVFDVSNTITYVWVQDI